MPTTKCTSCGSYYDTTATKTCPQCDTHSAGVDRSVFDDAQYTLVQAQLATANYTRVISLVVFLLLWNSIIAGLLVAVNVTAGPYSDAGDVSIVLWIAGVAVTLLILWFVGRAMSLAGRHRRIAERMARA